MTNPLMNARGAEVYRRTEAVSRSPLELVLMLYDGALRFTTQAREAAARGDIRGRAEGVSRTL
ncbi:MAG TPA: flagellar protein FliS, partial [Vicinamibacterales bacterium]|nr:flagellar protein FliS [Vicinamibacterales bacterium]